MPTLSLTVLPAKALKGGKNKVRIAVAHNCQTRYIVTDIIIDSPKEWKNGQIVKRDDAGYLNTRLRAKLNEVQQALDEVPYPEGLSCPELIETITATRKKESHTLRTAFEEMMSYADAKPSSLKIYRHTFNSIVKFLPENTRMKALTPIMVRNYVKKRTDITQPTLQLHIALLARIVNYCQQNKYTDYSVLPTAKIIKFKTHVRQNWLTPDQVRAIRDFDDNRKWVRRIRDLFILTYYLGGINTVDLCNIDFRGLERIKYIRTKTSRSEKINPFVEFDIPDEAKPIIERWMRPDGRLALFSKHFYSTNLSGPVRQFRELLGFDNMTMYSARKSFAQHAFQLGVSESIIDYILGHSLNAGRKSTIYSYIKVTPAMATAAIRKVLDFIHGNNNFD